MKGTPLFVARTKKGYEVIDEDGDAFGPTLFVDAEGAADHVEKKLREKGRKEEADRELALIREGTRRSKGERAKIEREDAERTRKRRLDNVRLAGGTGYPLDDQDRFFFYRLEKKKEDAEDIVKSGQLWGKERRNTYQGLTPSAKAHRGKLTPEELAEKTAKGLHYIEFVTDVPEDKGKAKRQGDWSQDDGVLMEDGWAKIPIIITNTTLSTS